MNTNRPAIILLSLLALAPALFAQTAPATAPTADDVARRAIDTMTGGTWDKVRYVTFTFVVEKDGKPVASFAEQWDRVTGDYRVRGKDQFGVDTDTYVNVKTQKSKALRSGAPITDPKLLADAVVAVNRRFTNDTFWLLMPFKAFEPGMKREYDGERTDSCGRIWDLVKITVQQTGGNGDVYWMWVNRDTGLVDEWDMKQQGSKADERPVEVFFQAYRRVGNILMSMTRDVKSKHQTVRISDLHLSNDAPPKDAFQK